jgi:hypothetical protein
MLRHGSLCALSLAAIVFVILTAPGAEAAVIAQESFKPSFPIYANSGVGFAGPWTQGGFNAFFSGYTLRDRSLCYRRLDTAGGSVSGDAFPAINGAVRPLAQPIGFDGTTVYVSFRIQPRGTLNDGIFNGFFGLTLNGSLGNDLFIGKPGGGSLEQYVIENRGGTGQVTSGVAAVVGHTTLLVVKAQFQTGPDVFTLYVDPPVNRPEPASSVMKTDLDLGLVSKIGIYSTGAFTIDEIRIGTTYADVVATGASHDAEFPGCVEDH